MEEKKRKIESKVYHKDARNIIDVLKDKVVDVAITSPPYFNLKDYGYKEQIGFGQTYDKYLEDLKSVFKSVYDCTKDSGTLWVIIDSFRKNGEVAPLPFDFSNKIKEVGWKLQDIIIWAKDKTVPWAHKGQMRNLFEYILVFSKNDKYNFYIDEIRNSEVLKKWWVKYPERYNPNGKTPDGIWHFDIPAQGSWGNGYIRHFCPLPESMIEQILKLTTKENDVVLDPFAGSGAVLAKAKFMKRSFIGFELNADYIQMFNDYLAKVSKKKALEYKKANESTLSQSKFKKLNLSLRALKYARVMYKAISSKIQTDIQLIYVENPSSKPTKDKWCNSELTILLKSGASKAIIQTEIDTLISKPPLSRFGINVAINLVHDKKFIARKISGKKIYTYTDKVTHKYKREIKEFDSEAIEFPELIVSKMKVSLNEKDYE